MRLRILTALQAAALLAGMNMAYAQETEKKAAEAPVKPGAAKLQMLENTTFKQAFDGWFKQIDQAFQENDREKMGKLLLQMEETRGKFKRSGGRFEGGTWVRRDRSGQGRGTAAGMNRPTLAKNDGEKKILDVLGDLLRNERRGMMNVPQDDGRVLRMLTEAINAKHVVEIGTSNGYSGIWICMALRATGGRLTTYEIDEGRASLARKNFKRAGVSDRVTLIMDDAHEMVKQIEEPIDLLFLDADKAGYIDYLEKLLPRVRPGGLIVAHNTTMPGGMDDYIETITTNPDLESLFIHQDAAGIGITLKKR